MARELPVERLRRIEEARGEPRGGGCARVCGRVDGSARYDRGDAARVRQEAVHGEDRAQDLE
ncbi:MAG: hypothetical protein CL862_11060 [Cyanobium sp. NAT70]|nr:hypothetical protein [Cyanobium sp. NAT70]